MDRTLINNPLFPIELGDFPGMNRVEFDCILAWPDVGQHCWQCQDGVQILQLIAFPPSRAASTRHFAQFDMEVSLEPTLPRWKIQGCD
jgi:hypothetical protein